MEFIFIKRAVNYKNVNTKFTYITIDKFKKKKKKKKLLTSTYINSVENENPLFKPNPKYENDPFDNDMDENANYAPNIEKDPFDEEFDENV